MQIAGVFVASFVMAPILTLLHTQTPGGIGGPNLSAPQASLFATLAEGFSGEGQLPWRSIAWGAVLGIVILVIDEILKRSKAGFRAHLMPIAVGMYLPFGLAIPILIGGLLAHMYSRKSAPETHDRILHRGVLFSSGVIAGEALTAVGLAALAAVGLKSLNPNMSPAMTTILTGIAALGIVGAFVVMTRPSKQST